MGRTLSEKKALEATTIQKLKSSKKFVRFREDFQRTAEDVKASFNDIVYNRQNMNEKMPEKLLVHVKSITDAYGRSHSLFDMMQCVEYGGSHIRYHSLKVGIISRMIGSWMKLGGEELDMLSVAGLLHDIGKVLIPAEVITKPDKLTSTEYDFVKIHTMYGYKILDSRHVDDRIKLVAKEHHERDDGTGYPEGLNGKEISLFSKIVAIADVYDAMTSNRLYRKGASPFQAISFLENNIQNYDRDILLKSIDRISKMYVNADVMTNCDIKGKVVKINRGAFGRPVIMTDGGRTIDLLCEEKYEITEIL